MPRSRIRKVNRVRTATFTKRPTPKNPGSSKNAKLSAAGQQGGKVGGKSRAKNLSAGQRKLIARKGAFARRSPTGKA